MPRSIVFFVVTDAAVACYIFRMKTTLFVCVAALLVACGDDEIDGVYVGTGIIEAVTNACGFAVGSTEELSIELETFAHGKLTVFLNDSQNGLDGTYEKDGWFYAEAGGGLFYAGIGGQVIKKKMHAYLYADMGQTMPDCKFAETVELER